MMTKIQVEIESAGKDNEFCGTCFGVLTITLNADYIYHCRCFENVPLDTIFEANSRYVKIKRCKACLKAEVK